MSQNHNRLLVVPKLTISREIGFTLEELGLIIKNNGLRPAVIRMLKLNINGREYDYTARIESASIFSNSQLREFGAVATVGNFDKNEFLEAGGRRGLISIPVTKLSDDVDKAVRFGEALLPISTYVRYESIYGDVYEYKLPEE